MYSDLIVRLSAGPINQINDSLPGGGGGNIGPQIGLAPGQIGDGFYLDDNNLLFQSTVGTVYAGHFRYVKLSASATAPTHAGQIVFWDTLANAGDSVAQVTTAENGSSQYSAVNLAGIVLNPSWTPGNYSVIQDLGLCYVKFRATLTAAGTVGVIAYAAGAGAGADLGTADVIDSATAATIATETISQMSGRKLGVTYDAPANGSLSRVLLSINQRG